MDSRNLMRRGVVGVGLVLTTLANAAAAGLERAVGRGGSTQRLISEDAGGADNFGSPVAVEGNVAVTGAASADGLNGAVYVFTDCK